MKVLLLWLMVQKISAEIFIVKFLDGGEHTFLNVEIIGRGGWAVVFRGEWRDKNMKPVALKISKCKEGNNQILTEWKFYNTVGAIRPTGKEDEINPAIEAGIAEVFNIGTIQRSVVDKIQNKNSTTECLTDVLYVLVMELAGTNLYHYTRNDNGHLNEFRAIQYLHAKGVMHGDIKPDNVAIRDYTTLKLCIFDFGSARIINEEHEDIIQGSTYYHSWHVTNLLLQMFEWLPAEAALKQRIGFKDDLETYVIVMYDIRSEVEWKIYDNKYSIYRWVSDSNYKPDPLKMSQQEKDANKLTQEGRNGVMKDTLLSMLASKEGLLKQIASLAPGIPQEAVDILKATVSYARTDISEAKDENLQEIVNMEASLYKKWELALNILCTLNYASGTREPSSKFGNRDSVKFAKDKKRRWFPLCCGGDTK